MAPVYNVVVATRKSTKMDKILTKVFDEELSIFRTVFNFVKENPTTILVGHISKSEVFVNLEFSFLKHGFTVLRQMKETEMLLLSEIVDVQTSPKSLKTFFSRDYEILKIEPVKTCCTIFFSAILSNLEHQSRTTKIQEILTFSHSTLMFEI